MYELCYNNINILKITIKVNVYYVKPTNSYSYVDAEKNPCMFFAV